MHVTGEPDSGRMAPPGQGTDGRMDWLAWHERYADPGSPLSRRLRLVQRHIAEFLDERPEPSLAVLSLCAGQGRDLIGVLADHPGAGRVHARLIELDERNATAARAAAGAARLPGVTVLQADAADPANFTGAVPADLVLLVGVLGNISDSDARTTIGALPMLCATGATVVWTRTRRAPDRTPAVRAWFAAAGFAEQTFDAPDGVLFSVGVHRFTGRPRPLASGGRLFTFTR